MLLLNSFSLSTSTATSAPRLASTSHGAIGQLGHPIWNGINMHMNNAWSDASVLGPNILW